MLHFPDRIHKRPFVVSMIVLAFILVVSGAVLLFLRMFGTANDFPIVSVSTLQSDFAVRDIGINLDHLPGSNLIGNPSFETKQQDVIFSVADSDTNSIFVSPDEVTKEPIQNGFFSGGTIRVLSVDESGKLMTKLHTTITDYSMNQLGMWSELVKPADLPEQVKILSSASSSSMTIGVGTQGTIIADMTSPEPSLVDTGIQGDYVALTVSANRFCAVSTSGEFTYSDDGTKWKTISPEPDLSGLFHTGTSIGKVLIAAGDYGRILICSDEEIHEIVSGIKSSFRTSTSDGNVVLVAGDNGAVQMTTNGLFFRSLSASELPSASALTDWTAADAKDGRFLLAGQEGALAVGTYDNKKGVFSFEEYVAKDDTGRMIQSEKAVFLPTGEILIVDSAGELFCSDITFSIWRKPGTEMDAMIESVSVLPSGRILLTQGTTAKLTQLYTEISIETSSSELNLRTGDTCILSTEIPSVSESIEDALWQVGGDNSIIDIQETAPMNGGKYSLRLSSDMNSGSEEAHFISQRIALTDQLVRNEGSIYEMKVWLKQEDTKNKQVMAWISGVSKPLGTTFTDVGNGWRQYSYSFILPNSIKDAKDIRLNIGFVGQGTLYIDKIYLGLAENSETFLTDDVITSISQAEPKIIRLENVLIGRLNTSSEAWMQSAGNDIEMKAEGGTSWGITSLESSLSLVRDAKADPWIVIHSAANEEDINRLMGYLCASLSDPYGKVRADNGTPVPWSMQFDRIVFEISDTDRIFQSDAEKSSYVNYIITLISSSPYYLDIQDKVIFLDGMEYLSKKMVSLADSHTWDISVHNYDFEQEMLLSFDAAVSSAYSLYFDQIPRIPLSEQRVVRNGEEWARSTNLTLFSDKTLSEQNSYLHQTITAAEFTEVILTDLGKHTSSLMFDLSVAPPQIDTYSGNIILSSDVLSEGSVLNQNQDRLLQVIKFLGPAVKGYRTDISVIPSKTAETSVEGLSTYAFSDDTTTYIVITNLSAHPLTFRLEAPWSMDGDAYQKYGVDGIQAESSKLAQRNNQITLLPGEVFLAEITH